MSYSKKETYQLLDLYHLSALKKYGQNFLCDKNIIDKIVSISDIHKDTTVIEIGPGIGHLTSSLSKVSNHIICYEIDRRFEPVLSQTLPEVKVIYEDIMKVSLDLTGDIVVISNLPYYITTDILKMLITNTMLIRKIVVMMQKEVADKLIDEVNPLSLMIHYVGDIQREIHVPRQSFVPAPHVDSTVVSITKERQLPSYLQMLIETSFTQKRKTIYNNLKKYKNIKDILYNCGINPGLRPHQLTLSQYIRIYEELYNED